MDYLPDVPRRIKSAGTPVCPIEVQNLNRICPVPAGISVKPLISGGATDRLPYFFMKKRDNMIRIGAIAVLYIAIALIYVGRLLYLQVSGQD